MKDSNLSLCSMLSQDRIVDLKSSEKMPVLREMVDVISHSDLVSDPQAFFDAVVAREKIMSTGIGIGIAVPHVKIPSIKGFVMAIGRRKEGIEFDALDGRPVQLVILIGAPEKEQENYLRVLARIVATFKNQAFLLKVLNAASPAEILSLFADK